MNKPKKDTRKADPQITDNRRAYHDYFIEERLEAGLVLEGWEVKSLRAGKVQLRDCYVLLKDGEAFLLGCLITPLQTASTHIQPDAQRTRKLLLHASEIAHLIGAVERKGYSAIALSLYWKNGRAKCQIGLAKGKKQHDKRDSEKTATGSATSSDCYVTVNTRRPGLEKPGFPPHFSGRQRRGIPVSCARFSRGRPGFDVGRETRGACRGAENLVNPTAKNIVANDDNYALAA